MTIAFLFPGQGAQSEGLLHNLPQHAEVTRTIAEASKVLGLDLDTLDNAQALHSTALVQLELLGQLRLQLLKSLAKVSSADRIAATSPWIQVAPAGGISANGSDSIHIWDARTGARLATIPKINGHRRCHFLPDGKRLLTRSLWDMKLWDADTGQLLVEFAGGHLDGLDVLLHRMPSIAGSSCQKPDQNYL